MSLLHVFKHLLNFFCRFPADSSAVLNMAPFKFSRFRFILCERGLSSGRFLNPVWQRTAVLSFFDKCTSKFSLLLLRSLFLFTSSKGYSLAIATRYSGWTSTARYRATRCEFLVGCSFVASVTPHEFVWKHIFLSCNYICNICT